MRGAGMGLIAAFALLLPAVGLTQDASMRTVRPIGSVTSYLLSNSHPFFGEGRRDWAEVSATGGGRLTTGRLTLELVGLAVRTIGTDPYGTASTAVAGTEPTGIGPLAEWGLGIDRAFIAATAAEYGQLTLTVGRQRLEIGSQFLIGDGVYDGFARGSEHGVYHNPRKSFDAARVQWTVAGVDVNAFGFLVHPTWDAGAGRDGRVIGVDLMRQFDRTGSGVALGALARSSRSNLDNDMTVLNVRLGQRLPFVPGLRASGELVVEQGRCRNVYYCTTLGDRMNESSWHAELTLTDTGRRIRPMLEAGLVHYSDDFTPLAPGASDWGQWYLGNQIDWISFASNTQVIRAQAGAWPLETVRVRVQYHNTRQAVPTGTSTGGTLSDEASLVSEWYPSSRLWVNVVLGYAKSGRALAASGLGNPFAGLNSGAVPVGSRGSFDVIVATGITF